MRFEAAAISDAGPRKINEDEAAFWSPTTDILIAAIADGLGGMGGGQDASRIAVQTLRDFLPSSDLSEKSLEAAAQAAHDAILKAQLASPELRRMATTLTAGVFMASTLLGVHCGDSRAAIARGSGILRLTSDQSEGERLFRAGKLTKEELRDYPRKNILDSALGAHDQPKIVTFSFALLPGDKFFLTTDGVHEKVLLREMREIAERHDTPSGFVAEVAEVVGKRTPEDNFSIEAVFVR